MIPAILQELNTTSPRSPKLKRGSVLVPVLIRFRLAGQFICGGTVVHVAFGIAADAVIDAEDHPCVGKYVFDAGAWYSTGGESLTLDDDRHLRQHRLIRRVPATRGDPAPGQSW